MKTMSTRDTIRSECGANLVEIMLGLPLFLLGVLISLWLGVALNESTGLKYAVHTGAELAQTRSSRALMGYSPSSNSGLIDAIEKFVGVSGGPCGRFDEIRPWLVSHNIRSDSGAEQRYRQWLSGNGYGVELCRIPRAALYALVYTYMTMEQVAGSTLTYPCDTKTDAKAGCLRCTLMPLKDMALSGCPGQDGCDPVIKNRFGIECSFRPDYGLLRPIRNLLGGSQGGDLTPEWGRTSYREWRLLGGSEFE
jgi:hypothetical protein